MPAIRFSGRRGIYAEEVNPGDLIMLGESVTPLATVGALFIGAAFLQTGIIYRSGSTAAYSDTFDNSMNQLAAMLGNGDAPAVVPGLSWKLRMINSVAFLQTIILGTGLVAGIGTMSVAATSWKDFLFTILSNQKPVGINVNTTNGSPVVTWNLNSYQQSLVQGPSPNAVNPQVGASAVGTGIPAGSTVIGITQGQGGTVGVTLSANATATGSTLMNLWPTVKVDAIMGGPVT